MNQYKISVSKSSDLDLEPYSLYDLIVEHSADEKKWTLKAQGLNFRHSEGVLTPATQTMWQSLLVGETVNRSITLRAEGRGDYFWVQRTATPIAVSFDFVVGMTYEREAKFSVPENEGKSIIQTIIDQLQVLEKQA